MMGDRDILRVLAALVVALLAAMVMAVTCGCKTYKESEHNYTHTDTLIVTTNNVNNDSIAIVTRERDSLIQVLEQFQSEYHKLVQRDSVYERDSVSVWHYEDGRTDTYHYKEKSVYKDTKELKMSRDSIAYLERYIAHLEDSIYNLCCVLDEQNTYGVSFTDESEAIEKVTEKKEWWKDALLYVLGALSIAGIIYFIYRKITRSA